MKKVDLQRQTTDEEDNEEKIDCSKVACMNVPFTVDCEAFSVAFFFSNKKKEKKEIKKKI